MLRIEIKALFKKSFIKPNNNRLIMYNKKLFEDFYVLLSEHLQNSRSVKYYADLLQVSPKKLNSITKMIYGKTAKEFIAEILILDSIKLLIETPDSVKQISYSLGFTEPTNFNKFFKKKTSVTPQQYREQYYAQSL